MRKITLFILSVCFCISTNQLFAWGQEGHRIIGQVAYQHLTQRAKKQVDKILGDHGVVYWANWADELKSDTIYAETYDWHFQDLNAGMTDAEVVATLTNYPVEGGNLWRATDSLLRLLHNQPANTDALRFIIHLTGDRFCPMHTGHLNDAGGNKIKFQWFGKNTNLHKVWDTELIQARGYSYSEYAEYLEDFFAAERKNIQQMSEEEILLHNYHFCQEIYAYQKTWDGNAYHYIYHFALPMEWQLYAAGIYLADILNELYG